MGRMHNPAHPGEMLREWIPEGMSEADAAARLGVSRETLLEILGGKAGVTAEMARRLSSWFKTTPEVWIEMQTSWDSWQEEQSGKN